MARIDLSKTTEPEGTGGSRRGPAMIFGGALGIAIGGIATALTGHFGFLALFAILGLVLGYLVLAPLIARQSH